MELNVLYNKDSLVAIKEMQNESIDLILTDPPYGIDYQSNWGRNGEKLEKIKNDNNLEEWFQEFSNESYRILKNNTAFYCFTRFDVYPYMYQCLVNSGFKVKNLMVVQKGQKGGNGDLQAQYSNDCELIIYANKGRAKFNKTQLAKTDGRKGSSEYRTRLPNVWFDTEYNKYPKSTVNISNQKDVVIHPTEKNVELLKWIIQIHSNVGDTVLDPFAGVGGTLVASKELNRKYIGYEIDDKYCIVTNEKIKCKYNPIKL